MSKYIDGKIRFCPICNENINDCKCDENKVVFVQLPQEKYDNLTTSQQKQENNS